VEPELPAIINTSKRYLSSLGINDSVADEHFGMDPFRPYSGMGCCVPANEVLMKIFKGNTEHSIYVARTRKSDSEHYFSIAAKEKIGLTKDIIIEPTYKQILLRLLSEASQLSANDRAEIKKYIYGNYPEIFIGQKGELIKIAADLLLIIRTRVGFEKMNGVRFSKLLKQVNQLWDYNEGMSSLFLRRIRPVSTGGNRAGFRRALVKLVSKRFF
jgi:hypothetical protein